MAERNITIRLALDGGGKVRAELVGVGDAGEKALKRIEQAGAPASRALKLIDGAAGEARTRIEGFASSLGPLGSGLMALGPAGLVAASGLAALTAGLTTAIKEGEEATQAQRRLEAVLKATGNASGLTSKQIVDFADGMERSMLVTSEEVQRAAAILATFRSVSGDTFTRALSLAQDMATVFEQDLSSSVTQLGKALEDPIEGLTALRRVGISFEGSQKDLIKALVEGGRKAEAQRVILDALQKQVGGAGAAEAGGLTGAVHRLTTNYKNLLEEIGKTPWIVGLAQRALEGLAENDRELLELLQQFRGLKSSDWEGSAGIIGDWQASVGGRDEAAARAGREAAEAEQRVEAIKTIGGELDKSLTRVATATEKIKAANDELAKTKKQLEALRTPETAKDVDAQIRRAEDLAARRIKEVQDEEKRRREAEQAKAEAAQRKIDQARKEFERNERIIAELERKRLGTETPRVAFVEKAEARLSDKATDDQIARTRQAAGAAWQAQAVDSVVAGIDRQAEAAERLAAVSGHSAAAVRRVTVENRAYAQAVQIAGEGGQEFLAIKERLLAALEREDKATAKAALANELRSHQDALESARLELSLMNETAERRAYEVALLREKKRLIDQFGPGYEAEIDAIVRVSAETARLNAKIKQEEEEQRQWELVFKQGVDNITTELEDALLATKSWDDALQAIATSLQKLIIDILIKQPLNQALTGFFSTLFYGQGASPVSGGGNSGWGSEAAMWFRSLLGIAGAATGSSMPNTGSYYSGTHAEFLAAIGYHQGGVAGEAGARTRQMPASFFADAPRFHRGGYPGLAPDEIPAILQRGERVLSRRETAALEAAAMPRRASAAPTVVMNITTHDANSFRASAAQITAGAARMIRRAGRDL